MVFCECNVKLAMRSTWSPSVVPTVGASGDARAVAEGLDWAWRHELAGETGGMSTVYCGY